MNSCIDFRGTVYWQIYGDIWNFHKKYYDVRDDDEYWDAVINEGSSVYKKYADMPEGEFAKQFTLSIIEELQRVYRRDKNEEK